MDSRQNLQWQLLLFLASVFSLPDLISMQIHYSIPEDQDPGSYVGNIAKDLGVDVRTLRARRLQLVSEGMRQYFQVNLADGMLLVNERLDREMLCSSSPRCSFPFQLVLENPLQLNRVEVEILDVNDNAPRFPKDIVSLEITEVANLGTRLRLEVAEDQDTGSNSIATYELSPNEHFALSINIRGDGVKIPEIVLEKLLDREKAATHRLILTALDNGNPVQSGTVQVTVHVLDANDNPPVCEPPVSKVYLEENIQVGTIVTKLNVTDLDEGPNGEVEYFFKSSSSVQLKLLDVFSLDSQTGEIKTKVLLDYEEANAYEIAIYIKDKGSPAMEGHCNIRVELVDVNDNSPEIMLTTLSSSVQEDAPIGTIIALIQAKDNDSEENGQVRLEIPRHVPFKLVSSFKGHYSLVTNGPLDREKTAGYSITIKATDSGIPQKSTEKTILIQVSDINDNAPTFSIASYTAHVEENTSPGTLVFSVSACDPDVGVNSKLSYSIVDTGNHGLPISTYFHINQENGSIYTSRVLDYEQEKVFQVSVEVKDSGFPPLSSTSTLHLFIVDQNDNAPVIVHPEVPKDSAFHQSLLIPVEPGYLVTKVVAVDADSGHNAWVSYHLLHETNEMNAFKVEDHSGEIRQAQPNTDWRFSQAQRPGTSGSQNGDENGTWPNNQFDTEMLQAMILASANEAAAAAAANPDGNSTLGGGATAGTMGLSTRYGPQFTLQHVPDYRQNVYIPGSTATLSNSAGKRDGKPAASGGGNKKKSGKKEKK
ncbi:protocadherin gamma-C5-like isoform X4 [Erythrolamprus reginae]|uniref:protocadherin gamma-C5-like isoform X4 n=1 Tax=Erythrolamprus reginae TaxID=121349 RepID=UPI00396CCE32